MDVKERTLSCLVWLNKNHSIISNINNYSLLILAEMVGLIGLEPMTPALSRRCSNQLSYRPRWLSSLTCFPDSRPYSN